MAVDERFSNGQTAIAVFTVGDLIEELQKLPAETPVRSDFSEGADVVLFNANTKLAHVRLCEEGEFTQDDDDLDADDDDEWFDDPEPRDDGGPL